MQAVRQKQSSRNQTKLKEERESIQGKENLANLASRGCYLKTLERSKKWFNAPEWLLYNKEKCPMKLNVRSNQEISELRVL